jgi:S-adenosyl methyltransferase
MSVPEQVPTIPDPDQVPAGVDPTTPSPARLYDYYLGGTTNFEVDRQAGERLRDSLPELADAAWANRGFHGRAAVWMAEEKGIRQFIDIGPGLPTQNNTHQAVHRVNPEARIVYVDVDPLVAAYSPLLLEGDGTTTLITADLREVDTVVNHPELRRLIDFSQPVGVLMTAVMHFIEDEADPWGMVTQYMSAMPAGSYLALSHATYDKLPPRAVQTIDEIYKHATTRIWLRSREDIERFFSGLEMVPPYANASPGLTFVGSWGAEDPEQADSDGSRVLCCAVARRP